MDARKVKIFDLSEQEFKALMKVGEQVGIRTLCDLLNVIRVHRIRSGSQLLNFVYAATVHTWLMEHRPGG